jgi:ribose 1,5-bisphosphokinase PhnN
MKCFRSLEAMEEAANATYNEYHRSEQYDSNWNDKLECRAFFERDKDGNLTTYYDWSIHSSEYGVMGDITREIAARFLSDVIERNSKNIT